MADAPAEGEAPPAEAPAETPAEEAPVAEAEAASERNLSIDLPLPPNDLQLDQQMQNDDNFPAPPPLNSSDVHSPAELPVDEPSSAAEDNQVSEDETTPKLTDRESRGSFVEIPDTHPLLNGKPDQNSLLPDFSQGPTGERLGEIDERLEVDEVDNTVKVHVGEVEVWSVNSTRIRVTGSV